MVLLRPPRSSRYRRVPVRLDMVTLPVRLVCRVILPYGIFFASYKALGSPNDCFTLLEPLFPRYMTIPALKVANVYLSHFRPSVEPTGESRIVQRLDSLWSSHIRGLAQAIHEILHGRDAALLPPELLGILRISVQVLISNMVRSNGVRNSSS